MPQRTPADVLGMVKDEGVEIIDFRFCDLPGLMQHFSVPAHEFSEDAFDEGYGFYHGHDRDLSLAVLERGRRCLVVHAPFRHHGGGTRTRDFTRDPARQRADLAMRDAALVRFTQKWHHRLPCDVRSARQRVGDWFRTKLA